MPEVIQLANGRVKIAGVRKRLRKVGKHEGGHRTEQMSSDMMSSWVSDVRQRCHRDSERDHTFHRTSCSCWASNPSQVGQLQLSECTSVNSVWVREHDLRENEVGCESR